MVLAVVESENVIVVGQRFGLLTAVARVDQGGSRGSSWRARCSCGSEAVYSGTKLRDRKSCGCRRPQSQESDWPTAWKPENGHRSRLAWALATGDAAVLGQAEGRLRVVAVVDPSPGEPCLLCPWTATRVAVAGDGQRTPFCTLHETFPTERYAEVRELARLIADDPRYEVES